MAGPITGILNRSPRSRQFHSGFVFVVVLLVVSRALPVLFDWAPAPPQTARVLADGAAIAAGRTVIVPTAISPHGPAYLAAIPLIAWRLVTGPSATGVKLEMLLLEHHALCLLVLKLLGALCWIALSLQLFYVVKWRTDYQPALCGLIFMTCAPAYFIDGAATGLGSVLALLVFNSLYFAMKVRSRGIFRDYLLCVILAALATAWAYHFVVLLLPFLYAHARSQNRHDNFFADLEWHGRFVGGLLVFVLMAILCQPQLWAVVPRLFIANPLLAIAAIPQHVHPSNLFLNNDLEGQLSHYTNCGDYLGVLRSFAGLIGHGALLVALLLGLRGLFQRDQRPWRPMALFAYTFFLLRLASGIPGEGTAIILVPILCVLLAIGVLGVVMRHAFQSERRVFTIVTFVLCIQPLVTIAWPVLSGQETTHRALSNRIAKVRANPATVFYVGPPPAGARAWFPQPVPQGRTLAEIYQGWNEQRPDIGELQRAGYRYLACDLQFLRQLAAASPAQNTELRSFAEQLLATKPIVTISREHHRGPPLILLKLR